MRGHDFVRILHRFAGGELGGDGQQGAGWDFPRTAPSACVLSVRVVWIYRRYRGGSLYQAVRGQISVRWDGPTIGLVRALWKLDVNHRAIANAETLHPIETQQTENYRSKKIVTNLTFTAAEVTRTRTEGEGAAANTTTRQFSLPNLFDLHSAALYLPSQP